MEYTYSASENGTHEVSVGVCDVCGRVYDPEEGCEHLDAANEAAQGHEDDYDAVREHGAHEPLSRA
jgi:hypothetical protein